MKAPHTAPRLVLAALALTMALTACTPQLETHGTTTAAPTTITIDPGTKPTYNTTNPTTRTNLETGQWEVGDMVKVELYFYTDDADGDGRPDEIPADKGGMKTQTLTCTTPAVPGADGIYGTTDDTPAQWTSDLPIIVAPAGATSVEVTYSYESEADPLTNTTEKIYCNVIGTRIPTTGTLVMPAPVWERESALMVVENIPDGSTAKITYSASPSSSAQWKNTTGAPATARFHLLGYTNVAHKFTLTIDDGNNPGTTAYSDVPYKAGNKYTIDARAQKPGTGGGNNQTITASSTNLPTDFFITNPSSSFIITGTEVDKVATTLGNVIGTKKINLTMPDVTTQVGYGAFAKCDALTTISLPMATKIDSYAFSECTALTTVSLPKAKDIGISAFQGCPALTDMSLLLAETIGSSAFNGCLALPSISLPLAETIGNNAFQGCTALTTISLPAATSIGWLAFHSCTALTRLELTAATAITVDSDTFTGINNNDPITLVLNSSAALTTLGITVENGTGENADKKKVTFTNGGATIHVAAVVDTSGANIANTITAP